MPAADSVAARVLPIGLAKDVKLTSGVGEGQVISIDDIEPVAGSQAWQVREKMLEIFA
jgi:predicted homoserine dehydrogenase-like protein